MNLKIMAATFIVGFIVFVAILSPSGADEKSQIKAVKQNNQVEWYTGGTLHRATIRQWHTATPQNKVATTADFIVATANEDVLFKAGEKAWKAATFAVAVCIDEGTAGVEELMSQPVTAISTMCMSNLKKDYPFLLSK